MPRDAVTALTASEAKALFADLASADALVLAVSGGPDSTALMWLAARWRQALKKGPELVAVTVDHGLRAASKREARDVAGLAKELGIAHRILRWSGVKPKTGLPQAAREARYRLLAQAAGKAGASHVLTAHTRDDQAETVVMRMSRGSGLSGLAAMQRVSPLPGEAGGAPFLVRPLLEVPKTRLIATLEAAAIGFADDPTNRDAAFTRARLRGLMPRLAAEGLDAARLALLARRLARADAALEAAVDVVWRGLAGAGQRPPLVFETADLVRIPGEIRLRLIGRAIDAVGSEGPVELGKLEALVAGLAEALGSGIRWRRSLAGALVTLHRDKVSVETAPPRRTGHGRGRRNALTKGRPKRARAAKSR
ncbi:MAG: tRNA lysidine(34) synthetase TilS [Proteobacteria bacterium]|nr:tRNA lysidine(34) synthetase TilS [Pseudomonadota bacterium]